MLAKHILPAVICLISLAACAYGQENVDAVNDTTSQLSARAEKTLARFEPTGETLNCVPTRRIRDIKPLSDELFLVRVGTSKYYLNRPTSACAEATRDSSSINYVIDGVPNLCRGETVTVTSNRPGTAGLTLGGCGLGVFEEVREKYNKAPSRQE